MLAAHGAREEVLIMEHKDEYEEFIGGTEEEPGELCPHCNDWPCRCLFDEQDQLEYL